MRTKAELRRDMQARLARSVASDSNGLAIREAWSRSIRRHIEASRFWAESAMVCAFLPMAIEPLIASLWSAKSGVRSIGFPRLCKGEIEVLLLDETPAFSGADWRLNHADLDKAKTVPISDVDLILAPGLAFTPGGKRLGRGGGFYDRLLSRKRNDARVMGVCFDLQLLDEIPEEPHDAPMDAIVTERGIATTPPPKTS